MRVIAGSARGRPLKAPRGTAVRPTTDRVREAMFSSLGSLVDDAVVLDLFAGTGALGIEALSRGAAHATFVERDAATAGVVTANLAAAGVADRAVVRRADASSYVRAPEHAFTLVLCDPPYDMALADVTALLRVLADAGGLAPDATIVIERDKRDPALRDEDVALGALGFLAITRHRSYGDTVLLYCEPVEGA